MNEQRSVHGTNLQSLDELAERWRRAKLEEVNARDHRLVIEHLILEHPEVKVSDEGTTRVGPFVIRTGYSRKWSQRKLDALHEQLHEIPWPFDSEWKEVRARSKRVEEREPAAWRRIIAALTLTPTKPYITLAED